MKSQLCSGGVNWTRLTGCHTLTRMALILPTQAVKTVQSRTNVPAVKTLLAVLTVPAIVLIFVSLLGGTFSTPAFAAGDGCVSCHSNHNFLVRNKKLYDYYRDWKDSIHAQEGVSCSDCHGGNPKAKNKDNAHSGKGFRADRKSSPSDYRNIPTTCARCHDSIFAKYRQSEHFEHLRGKKGERQGPNCVTCHGSVSTAVLTVTSVRETCNQCHNEQTGNAPEIPGQAEKVLNTFLSIHRYYRYIGIRAEPNDARSFFRVIDPLIEKLNAEWHSFDIQQIARQTKDVLKLMKAKRNEIKKEKTKTK